MGTNFYLRGYRFDDMDKRYERDKAPSELMDPGVHLGKRSAAGLYCWDCRRTLYHGGEEMIHRGEDQGWFERCPLCGKGPELGTRIGRSAAIELGLAMPRKKRPRGVAPCSSFSWAQPPEEVRAFMEANTRRRVVVNEYGDVMTARGFLSMVESNCPIQFVHFVGSWFS